MSTSHQPPKTFSKLEHWSTTIIEYDNDFLKSPLWLSPFKMPPKPGLKEHIDLAFSPIFGLFDDSLPDGWGLMLMDRFFSSRGIQPTSLSVLDRLSYLGENTMGALTYKPTLDGKIEKPYTIDLHNMANAAYEVLNGSVENVLPALLHAGGSPGGARPKVLVGIKDNEMLSDSLNLPNGYAHWLVKFHSKIDAMDDGKIEYAYSLMAKLAGIEMMETRLFKVDDEKHYFGVKRFDRQGSKRFHIHTFGNLVHANFRIPNCDYELLLKVTKILTKKASDVEAVFRLMVFNVMTHNRDDHVKNFSFKMNEKNEWEFAPAYDLTFSNGLGDEHSMTVNGEGNPKLDNITILAKGAGIKPSIATNIVEEVREAVKKWKDAAELAGLSPKISDKIANSHKLLE